MNRRPCRPSNSTCCASRPKTPVIAYLRERLNQTTAPDRRDRVELAAIDFHWPNASLVHGFDHDLGYNPIRLRLFEDATGAGDHLALPEQREFSKLYPFYRSILSDMLGLRFIATGVPIEEIDENYKPGDLVELTRTARTLCLREPPRHAARNSCDLRDACRFRGDDEERRMAGGRLSRDRAARKRRRFVIRARTGRRRRRASFPTQIRKSSSRPARRRAAAGSS